eukprot:PITA_22530
MLSGAVLGQELWVEVEETGCYLFNISPSSALEDKTPQEVWTGKKPSLSHLRVFGCDVYVHVRKDKITMLHSKYEWCTFIGEVVDLEDGKIWKEAIVDEKAFLHKNEACNLVELSTRRKTIERKWVSKKKMNAKDKMEKHKSRLVAKGDS